jgi:[ribosomal protein S18]-alanine N-acetyltransferase
VAKPAESPAGAWQVRRAQPSDRAEIAALGAAAFARGWSPASIADELTRPDTEGWALGSQDPARPLDGFLLARRIPAAATDLAPGGLEVLLLAVRAAARRRGGASALLAALLEAAQRAGLGSVHLDVRASNRAAIDLYRRHGFAVVGRRPRYYEAQEDAILMSLALEPG